MSTRNPTHGTKVKDSSAPEIHEGAGAVAADSLAAESKEFQEENRNAEPLGVKGANSTFANTNTSGAVQLDAAKDAESRQEKYSADEASGVKEKKQGYESGRPKETSGGKEESHAGVAPTYVNSQAVDHHGPHGKNLKEVDSLDGKNASFNNEIGTKNDPGRVAEEKFVQKNADDARGLAGFPKQSGESGENPYATLKDSAA